MKLDLKTLSEEQKKLLSLGYKIYLNAKGKIVEEEPTEKTQAFLDYKKEKLTKNAYSVFHKTLEPITSKYSADEQATFELKVREAEKVKAGGTSAFLEALMVEGEEIDTFADTILANSEGYKTLYAMAEKTLRETLKNINS